MLPARAAQGRHVVRCRGAALWGGAGAQQCGAALGCSVRPRRGAAWGRGGAWRGAAYGCGMGPRMGAAWGCAGAQ